MGNLRYHKTKTEQIKKPNPSTTSYSDNAKSICEININTKLVSKFLKGFLLKFFIEQETFYYLIINLNDINYDIIDNTDIDIYYDSKTRNVKIKLDKNKRYIKTFIDLVVVELLEDDNIPKDSFLYLDILTIILISNKLLNVPIYIPYYELKESIKIKGIIKEINNYEFTHTIKAKEELLGYPIIYDSSTSVIGINKKNNSGYFFYPIIKTIEEDIRKKRNKGKYEKGKNIMKVNLKIIYQMVKELNIILMEIFYIKEILLMEYLKVKENIFTMMVIIS